MIQFNGRIDKKEKKKKRKKWSVNIITYKYITS